MHRGQPMNKDNLLKLAKFLDTLDQEQFHMKYLRAEKYDHSRLGIKLISLFPQDIGKDINTCNSIGCTLGWAVSIPEFKLERGDFSNTSPFPLLWNEYCYRIFDISPETIVWDFLFSEEWEHIDNTPTGAASRIRYVLEGDIDLSDFELYTNDCEGNKIFEPYETVVSEYSKY